MKKINILLILSLSLFTSLLVSYNWSWARKDHLIEDLDISCKNTKEYIDEHLAVCARLNKPLVMEEFGYPRDGFVFDLNTPTKGRDGYYKYVFSLVDKEGLACILGTGMNSCLFDGNHMTKNLWRRRWL